MGSWCTLQFMQLPIIRQTCLNETAIASSRIIKLDLVKHGHVQYSSTYSTTIAIVLYGPDFELTLYIL